MGEVTEDRIRAKSAEVYDLLIRKNRDDGDSALHPIRVFSKADPVDVLKVRIDDKLSRIASHGEKHFAEDTLLDLVGYLILLMIAIEGKDE